MRKLLLDQVSAGAHRSIGDATTLIRPRFTETNDEPVAGNPPPGYLVDGRFDASVIDRTIERVPAVTQETAPAERPLGHQTAWDHLDLDELAAIQRQVRAAIDAKRKLAGRLRQMDLGIGAGARLPPPLHTGKSAYRALVSQVAPAHLRGSVDKLDRCMLGISLGGSNALTFHGAKLEAIVRWIATRATRCCVLVGDSVGRISLEVREGLPPEVAEREARALGRRYAAETEAIFRHYTTSEVSFEIRYGTDYADHKNFRPYLQDVHALYNTDDAFRALVHSFGGDYQARTVRSLGNTEVDRNERWHRLAHEYLLEEIALFACLAEDGWPVLVYPGSIDSIVEVAEGRHPALPAPLRALGFISLWLDAKSGSR
jgi:tRNA-dependent cyclodipeptide synthase